MVTIKNRINSIMNNKNFSKHPQFPNRNLLKLLQQ